MGCYVCSGVAGNLFSAMCEHDMVSVGASTAINGLLTGILAMILANWEAFSGNPQLEQARCCLLFFIVFMVAMNITGMGYVTHDRNDGWAGTDYLGHAGGCMGGLFYGLAFFPRAPT